jgi:hypothetical protein
LKKTPRSFAGREPRTLDDFVTQHFEPGPKRNVARRLYRALEEAFDVDLARLHPDDTMRAVIGEIDSLAFVELIASLEEGSMTTHPERPFAECTFRELVDLY